MADQALVSRLKDKLREAVERSGGQAGPVMKVLRRLSSVTMTIEILQHTHIGKEVNALRKTEGEVGRMAKQIVRSWKQLLSDSSEHTTAIRAGSAQLREEEGGRSEGEERRVRDEKYRAVEEDKRERRKKHHHMDSQPHGPDTQFSGQSRSSGSHSNYVNGDPLMHNATSAPPTSDLAPPPSTSVSVSPSSQPGLGESGSGTPAFGLHPVGQRKRKAVLDNTVDAVALTKRSRTQVYSGKKAVSGPQAVPSLFDLSMRVLMDNIDAIEEVGGVPYLILEPLLQKCTVSQLLRLEELNPHFLEDSDVLWERHCQKDFRGFRPQGQQTWRELYLGKLSEREERLRSITANIRKREEARKEPVRQTKLAIATRVPGRRRQQAMPLPPRSSLMTRGLERPGSNVSKLRKQTMKMAKERSMMVMSRPGKR